MPRLILSVFIIASLLTACGGQGQTPPRDNPANQGPVSVTPSVTSGRIPLSITFTPASTLENATFTWDFGDGSEPVECAEPTHTFSRAGTFLVTLTAENETEAATVSTTITARAADTRAPTPPRTCCRTCSTGKPCGDGCIARDKTCNQPRGCAC